MRRRGPSLLCNGASSTPEVPPNHRPEGSRLQASGTILVDVGRWDCAADGQLLEALTTKRSLPVFTHNAPVDAAADKTATDLQLFISTRLTVYCKRLTSRNGGPTRQHVTLCRTCWAHRPRPSHVSRWDTSRQRITTLVSATDECKMGGDIMIDS